MQGPRGPGSPKVQRRHVPRLAEPEEILRREGGRKEIVAEAADAQPSVDALVRADPIVHYTVNSTVNGYLSFQVHDCCRSA
jgi:hypothetical protein